MSINIRKSSKILDNILPHSLKYNAQNFACAIHGVLNKQVVSKLIPIFIKKFELYVNKYSVTVSFQN